MIHCKNFPCRNEANTEKDYPFCDACMINTAINMLKVSAETHPIDPDKLDLQNIASILKCIDMIKSDYMRMLKFTSKLREVKYDA